MNTTLPLYRIETLWLGVHKTGTTFLQKSLDLSQLALRAHGIDYMDLDSFRDAHTRPLFRSRPRGFSAPPPARSGTGHHHLVFDENIIAPPSRALSAAALYPDAASRVTRMAARLGLQRPTLVLGLRKFSDYLPSLYCEVLKVAPFLPFSDFFVTEPRALSWANLVDRLGAAFPDSQILIYRAEQVRGAEARLLSAITGLHAEAFTLLPLVERPGFSDRAIRSLKAAHKAGPLSPAEVRQANRRFPRGPAFPAFDPWTPERRAKLDDRYARDLDRIAHYPRVSMIELGQAAAAL